MGERQDEVLVELVHGREREHAVVARAPGEVRLHVVQRVVHPAHVPLEVEAQSAVLGRVGHERPRGGLLGDHHDVGVLLAHDRVGLADERGGVEVLLGALLVEALLARVVDAEVHVEHRRDAVHADAVGVEEVRPEQGVGHEEGANLAAAIVELVGVPVGMDLVLVEHAAVEVGQALGVGAEAAAHPVEDHADAGLVAGIDEVHELARVAVAGRGGVVAGGLVAPGAVERVLVDGHDLDVGVAHLLDVLDELVGEVVVGVHDAALRGERVAGAGIGAVLAGLALGLVTVATPAAQVHLEDVERLGEHVAMGALLEVVGVLPGVAVEVEGARGGAGDLLGVEAVRVGLVELAPVVALDEVLVERALLDAGNKALPDATGLGRVERRGRLVPAVEVADDVDAPHVRRPDGKVVAVSAVVRDGGVGAHLLVAPVPLAASKEEEVIVAQVESAVERFHVTLLEGLCTGQHSLCVLRQPGVHEKAVNAGNETASRAR